MFGERVAVPEVHVEHAHHCERPQAVDLRPPAAGHGFLERNDTLDAQGARRRRGTARW